MKAKFLVQLLLDFGPPKDRAYSKRNRIQPMFQTHSPSLNATSHGPQATKVGETHWGRWDRFRPERAGQYRGETARHAYDARRHRPGHCSTELSHEHHSQRFQFPAIPSTLPGTRCSAWTSH